MICSLATQASDISEETFDLDPRQTIALLILCGILCGILLYFLPSIVGMARRHPNSVYIFALNLFLGWSFVGWGLALVWALSRPAAAAAQTPALTATPTASPTLTG